MYATRPAQPSSDVPRSCTRLGPDPKSCVEAHARSTGGSGRPQPCIRIVHARSGSSWEVAGANATLWADFQVNDPGALTRRDWMTACALLRPVRTIRRHCYALTPCRTIVRQFHRQYFWTPESLALTDFDYIDGTCMSMRVRSQHSPFDSAQAPHLHIPKEHYCRTYCRSDE